MRALRGGLVGAPPERPGDDVRGLDASLCEPRGNAPDLLHGPADEAWRLRAVRSIVFGGAERFAWWRMVASMAKASITNETWRCQPCQERVSLWSKPSSFVAVSKLSSIAQRCPSTATSVSTPVPAGHQVVKQAYSPSAMVRRISPAAIIRDAISLRRADVSSLRR